MSNKDIINCSNDDDVGIVEVSEIKALPILAAEDGLSAYLREINNIPCLSKEEEFLLAKAYLEQQDLNAAHRLVKSHLKLVAKIAMKYRHYGLPVSELISEGNIGLMQAVKKYDPDLGYRLSTYSMWWIKASIQEYVLKSWSLVKIGTTAAQKKLFFALNKIRHKIHNLYARNIGQQDYDEIADHLGVTYKEVAEMDQRLSAADLSLNTPTIKGDDQAGEMMDFVSDARPAHDELLETQQLSRNKHKILLEALKQLNEREMQIFVARKLTNEPSTLETLSSKYHISKERIRQIENRAYEKVQQYVLAHMSADGQRKLPQYPS
jgi:RNA polymerase sigma-32 factor